MESIFTRMLDGREPCVLLTENADHAAVLEACPASPGHTVVFPKKVTDALFDLTPDELGRLMQFAQTVAKALKSAMPCDKVAAVVYGLKVRHAHVHLIPVNGTPAEIALDKPRPAADPQALTRLAAQIQVHLPKSG